MITSKDNDIVRNAAKLLKSSKHRKTARQFTAEGVRLCRDGVRSGYKPALFLYTGDAVGKYKDAYDEIIAVSERSFEVSRAVFERISDTKSPQGFFCVFNILDKNKKMYRIDNQNTYIGLENIQDPSNMAVFRLPFTIKENFGEYLRELLSQGVSVYGSTPYDAEDITNVKFTGGVMLIGNEGAGLTQETLALCTAKVRIPMRGRAESLNAAAAAGILMWEMLR